MYIDYMTIQCVCVCLVCYLMSFFSEGATTSSTNTVDKISLCHRHIDSRSTVSDAIHKKGLTIA
jgi:hypothetical protein